MKKDKIIFLSAKNPNTRKDWSGIPYFMFHHLSNYYDVEYVSPPAFFLLRKIGYYFSKAFHLVTGTKYLFEYGFVLAWLYGCYYSIVLRNKKGYSFVFSPAGLIELSFIRTDIPLIAASDCSVLQLVDYYPSLFNVSGLSKYEIENIERRALKKISLVFLSSAWATNFFSSHFGFENTFTLPFGANSVSESILAKVPNQQKCRLIFIGVDWERKGGGKVLEIHRKLLELNLNSHLTIIGSVPPTGIIFDDRITVINHINKDSEQGEAEFTSNLQQADFFILPTKADCTPIVIAEALAFGVPVLTSRTGGISSMIQDGYNGFLFDVNDTLGYALKIIQLRNNVDLYRQVSENCIRSNQQILNWRIWAASFHEQIKKYLKN